MGESAYGYLIEYIVKGVLFYKYAPRGLVVLRY